ncbi:hypothetical protein DFH28DRAFT_903367 [Melampsora americana]|nr:hypothetical protein DFH28DRAFT_903367 [Melampsora americana]
MLGVALGITKKEPIESNARLLPVEYNSFFKNAKTIRDLEPESSLPKSAAIQNLANKVRTLVHTLPDTPVPQTSWLETNQALVQECQRLSEEALSQPQSLGNLERLWAVGIWTALETGKKEKTKDNIHFTSEYKQVSVEVQVALHHGEKLTEAFEHWVTRKPVSVEGHDHGLEEALKRAALIGKHEKPRGVQSGQLISQHRRLVSEYLLTHTIPRDPITVERIQVQFREIFKELKAESQEGQYAVDMMQHLLDFWSYDKPKAIAYEQVINDETLTRNINEYLAKRDIFQLSDKLKKVSSRSRSKDLYKILSNPSQPPELIKDAINRLLIDLKTVEGENLKDAYNLIMAHDHLGHYVERELLSETPSSTQWDMVNFFERAWSQIYPGFRLGYEDPMAYNYEILVKHPHLLAHAKWHYFMQATKQASKEPYKSLWDIPSTPYSVSNYGEPYYHKIGRMMSDGRQYSMGLEMLMHLSNYLPEGPEYLLDLLTKEPGTFRVAIEFVTSGTFRWHSLAGHAKSEQDINELNHFVRVLDTLIQSHSEQDLKRLKAAAAHLKQKAKSQMGRIKNRLLFRKGSPSVPQTEADKLKNLKENMHTFSVEQWRAMFQKTSPAKTKMGDKTLYWPPLWQTSWNLD